MVSRKTALLLCPHLMSKGGNIWNLLHIEKEKNNTSYTTEPVTAVAVKKYFPGLTNYLVNLVNQFSEKKLQETRAAIEAAHKKAGQEKNSWFNEALERKLYQDMAALKPMLADMPCYHQIPVAEDQKRFKTLACRFSNYTPVLRFQVKKSKEGYYYIETELGINGSYFPLAMFAQYHFLLEHRNEYFILRHADYKIICWLQQLDWKQEGADPAHFSGHILSRLENEYSVARNSLLDSHTVIAEPVGGVLLSELGGQFLMLTPQFNYDGFTVEGTNKETAIFYKNGKEYIVARNKNAEQAIIASIENLHENFKKQVNGYFYLLFEEAQKRHWFLKAFRQLLSINIEVLGMDMLMHFRYCSDKPLTFLKIKEEKPGCIYIDFKLFFGKEEIPFGELQKTVRSGQHALPLKDGSIALLEEEWLSKYAIIVKHAVMYEGSLRLAKWLAVSLEENEAPTSELHVVLKKEWWQKWQKWQSAGTNLYPLPASIRATLRPYQQKGYEWLRLLHEIDAGMLLADDMGLGKTLQTICFLASLLEQGESGKILIVCPTSLLYNWQNELTKFAPSLRHYVYHGPDRNREVLSDEKLQIIISSYGTLRSDDDLFLSYSFLAVVLDESHNIKNPSSQITKLVHTLTAGRRITLSGTPVMNNTFDLYSQLEFILPGMFGSQSFFKKEYADPIDRDKNRQRIIDLQKLTTPFVLRRTKEQVAGDLPPKTETILWCQMEEGQQQVYEQIKSQVRGELTGIIKELGLQKSKLHVLQGILKLRQVCNSPALLNDSQYTCSESIKARELLEEIEYNLSDHKALVFSQFTSMLDILGGQLEKKKIPYLVLTGSTPAKERERMVQEFNKNESNVRIFLLSLKAGNAGMNLTAADYVFLFDPWWNNAVEQQAIDRAHRIGQTRNVFAYKLICKNTIEERIIHLQQQKKNLAGSLIVEEDGFVKSLTEEDIDFLLK